MTLESGEKLTADVIVGADGSYSIARQSLVNGPQDNFIKTGIVMYKYVASPVDPSLESLTKLFTAL